MGENSGYRLDLQPEKSTDTERIPIPESEYRQFMVVLIRARIIHVLSETKSEKIGVVGVNGEEYPAPTWEEVREVFRDNRELVEAKYAQGFTRLQMTPLAVPVPELVERVKSSIKRHFRKGGIFQTQPNPNDPDTEAKVNPGKCVWIWDKIIENYTKIVYLPREFNEENRYGMTKKQVIVNPSICAFPGWSIGLVENMDILPQQGNGETIGGRRQLENNLSPREYLKILQGPQYQGESGWTCEDFLINFLTKLEQTGRVSHEWFEKSALWMVGSYLPDSALFPYGEWVRSKGRLDVDADGPDDRDENRGGRSVVRLGK